VWLSHITNHSPIPANADSRKRLGRQRLKGEQMGPSVETGRPGNLLNEERGVNGKKKEQNKKGAKRNKKYVTTKTIQQPRKQKQPYVRHAHPWCAFLKKPHRLRRGLLQATSFAHRCATIHGGRMGWGSKSV
jgi:hypothetical protein